MTQILDRWIIVGNLFLFVRLSVSLSFIPARLEFIRINVCNVTIELVPWERMVFVPLAGGTCPKLCYLKNKSVGKLIHCFDEHRSQIVVKKQREEIGKGRRKERKTERRRGVKVPEKLFYV